MSVNHKVAKEVELVHEESNDLSFRQLVSTKNHGLDLSLTWVEIDGKHRRLMTNKSTRVYYILEGIFTFHVVSEAEICASAGDVVVIGRSKAYDFFGKGKYLVINGPAFQEGDDIYLP